MSIADVLCVYIDGKNRFVENVKIEGIVTKATTKLLHIYRGNRGFGIEDIDVAIILLNNILRLLVCQLSN